MQMKRVGIFCITVLITCLAVGCTSEPKEPGRYYNKSKGFSIKLPDGWKEQNPDAGIIIKVANPENTAAIGVQAQKLSKEQTLTDALKYMKTFIQRQGGQIISEGETDIDNYGSLWFTCRLRNEILLEYLIIKENYIYAILSTFNADTFSDDLENEMREVAKSFRFE